MPTGESLVGSAFWSRGLWSVPVGCGPEPGTRPALCHTSRSPGRRFLRLHTGLGRRALATVGDFLEDGQRPGADRPLRA